MISTRKLLGWTAGVGTLAFIGWLALREPVQMASVDQATRGPIETSFVEEGRTRLIQRYVVTAPVAGMLRRIALEPGDRVQARQVVAEIEPATSTLLDPRARSQAQAELRSGESAVAAAHERIRAAAAADTLARADLRRAQELKTSGVVTQAYLDSAQTRAATSAAELAAARAEERVANQRVAAARATLADEGRPGQGKVLPIQAPVDGVVLKRPLESAAPVSIGQALMEIGDPEALEIEAEVLSTQAVRLTPGMPARILRWGGEAVLQARVRRVEPGGFTKVSALGVEEQRTRVVLDFVSPRKLWSSLGDAYRVEIEFVLQQEENVLQVPGTSLFRVGQGWAVYRLENGRARRTPIELGLRSATTAQIQSGLQAGDTVIVQPDDRISDGTRIEPVPNTRDTLH